jgi:hypothetical protein
MIGVDTVIAWCGFVGAWLRVAGPPDQLGRNAPLVLARFQS